MAGGSPDHADPFVDQVVRPVDGGVEFIQGDVGGEFSDEKGEKSYSRRASS